MASMETRERSNGTTSWRVTWREAGIKRSETFERKADAVAFRGMVDAAGQRYPTGWIPGQGLDAGSSGVTVKEWSERSVAARTAITEGTRDRYRRLLEQHVYPVMGSWPMDAVTRERASLWLNTLIATRTTPRRGQDPTERNLSAKTIRNVHGLVSSIWKDAIANDVATSNPFAGLKLPDPGPDREEMAFLTREEFAVLYGLTPAPYQLLVRTMVETGMRWGEVTALQVRHLSGGTLIVNQAWKADGNGRTVIGSPKTLAGRRTVSLPAALTDDLAVSAGGKRGDEWLFTSPEGHALRNGTFHTRVWIPLMAQVEPLIGKRPRIHDLRHTHVSWLIHDGHDVYRIASRVGHSNPSVTTQVYGHLIDRDDSDITASASSGVAASAVAPIRSRRVRST